MKKILSIIGIIFLVVLMLVPLVSASYVCPAAQTDTTGSSPAKFYANYPSTTSEPSAQGFAFTSNATAFLYNLSINMMRTGAITGSVVAQLTNVQSGSVGSNAYPGSTIYSTSYAVNINTFSASLAPVVFTFDGTYEMQASTNYCMIIYLTDESGGSSSSYVGVGFASITASLNKFHYLS